MNFSRHICPICDEETTGNGNDGAYTCLKDSHYYRVNTNNNVKIIFEDIYFESYLSAELGYVNNPPLQTSGKIFNLEKDYITISCEAISILKTEDNIIDYINNSEIMK